MTTQVGFLIFFFKKDPQRDAAELVVKRKLGKISGLWLDLLRWTRK